MAAREVPVGTAHAVWCLLAYTCPACGEVLRPAEEGCCIFCTYGSVPCPPIQARRRGAEAGAYGA
jgi:hypothetical protein